MNDSLDSPAAPAIPDDRIAQASAIIARMRKEIGSAVIGQKSVIDQVLACCLAGGHVLIEGVPGLGKTLLVKALAKTFAGDFSRIQFTPDLMPADVMGHAVFDIKNQSFSVRKGPVFTHLLLADEINRAPAKTQSSLLEVMQERQVTIEGQSYELAPPFMVLATQNPIDQEGTYQLPEAQLDRFLLKVTVGYPSKDEELEILDKMATSTPPYQTKSVATPEQVSASRELVNEVYIDPAIRKYIVQIIHTTRFPGLVDAPLKNLVRSGASPRGTINLALTARARAFMQGRAFVTPQDVKDMALDVLRHRILLTYEAEAEEMTTDSVIERIMNKVAVP